MEEALIKKNTPPQYRGRAVCNRLNDPGQRCDPCGI